MASIQSTSAKWITTFVVISGLLSRAVFCSRIANRLKTVETRLDVTSSELANFRKEVLDIWESVENLNESHCSTVVHTETIDGSFTREYDKFALSIKTGFMDEKKARTYFMQDMKKQVQDWQSASEVVLEKMNNRFEQLFHKAETMEETIAKLSDTLEKTSSDLSQKYSSLLSQMKQYENLQDVIETLQRKVRSVWECEENWSQYEGSCYFLSNTTETWSKAEEFCWSHRSRLVEYRNKEEVDFVQNLAQSYGEWGDSIWTGFWTGATALKKNGFYWRRSGEVTFISPWNWLDGQPDNWKNNKEFCMMSLVNRNGQWNDAACEIKLKFVCEKLLLL